jgi:PAS domain S-box-containing protein
MDLNSDLIRPEEKIKLLLRENELLSNIVNGATDSSYAKDLEGKYLTINEAGAQYLGRTVDEVIGKTDEELFGESGKEFTAQDARLFNTEQSINYESKVKINGKVSYFWTAKMPLRNQSGELIGLTGISREITHEKVAEHKYKFMFETAPVAMWEEDFSEVKQYFDEMESQGVTDFRKHFEQNSDAVQECINRIKILNVNESAVSMNSVVSKEVLLPGIRQNFTPESESVFIEEFVALANGETNFRKEASIVNDDGEVVEVIFNIGVLPGHEADLSLVLVTIVDVTDIRKLTSELKTIKHRYQSIVEAQTSMICRLNPNGQVIFENLAFTKFFEHKKAGKKARFASLFPPEELDNCIGKMRALDFQSPTTSCAIRNYDEDGGLVWQEWTIQAFFGTTGTLLGYQAVGSDITDRKLAEEALAASEARWRSVFNEYTGIPASEKWAGLRLEEVLEPRNAARAQALLKQVVINPEPLKAEIQIDMDNGRKRIFGLTLSPIKHGKRVLSVVCIARDITAKKRDEKLTREALFEGQEQERTRISQELHDGLGQLFTAIKFNLQNIKTGVSEKDQSTLMEGLEELEENLDIALREVKNISHDLMPDVLAQYGIKPAIENMISKLRSSSNVSVHCDLVDVDCRFSKEVEMGLFRICQELVNNSIRHSECQNVYVQLVNSGDHIALTVEDDGRGFEVKNTYKGFGLHNIKSRAEVLDGNVEIDTSVGGGTVTTVEIPLNQ